ncbi:hypothetical protein AB0D92_35085 [Streptomyces parvus]|uniref:DUF7739 domain-containing protein n=1 Tax=Streptomyces parvus TaxID=66428 RepID=UPI0033ED407E
MPHIAVSHGGDFFGLDHHPHTVLAQLAPWAANCIPQAQAAELAPLLTALETPQDQKFLPEQAAQFAAHLRKTARNRFLKGKPAAAARALADAATRAAADHEPWHWTLTTDTAA